MEETRTTEALIISREPYREYDSFVTIYTPDLGKLRLVARGTRKQASKLAGHIEPLTRGDIMIVRGRGLDYIGSALTKESYPGIRADLNKLYYAGQALRIFDRTVKEGQGDRELFRLIISLLEQVDKSGDGEMLAIFFTFRLLVESGYKPELYRCLSCHEAINPSENSFDLLNGGLLCRSCADKKRQESDGRNLVRISDNAIKIIRFMTENSIEEAAKLRIDKRLTKEIADLARFFLEFNS